MKLHADSQDKELVREELKEVFAPFRKLGEAIIINESSSHELKDRHLNIPRSHETTNHLHHVNLLKRKE